MVERSTYYCSYWNFLYLFCIEGLCADCSVDHWILLLQGWCNNIAWNIGPLTWRQYEHAVERYEYNRVESFRSIVPIVHLAWSVARNVRVTDPKLYELIKRTLARTLRRCHATRTLTQTLGKTISWQARAEGEPAPYCLSCEASHYCNSCQLETLLL